VELEAGGSYTEEVEEVVPGMGRPVEDRDSIHEGLVSGKVVAAAGAADGRPYQSVLLAAVEAEGGGRS